MSLYAIYNILFLDSNADPPPYKVDTLEIGQWLHVTDTVSCTINSIYLLFTKVRKWILFNAVFY